MRPSVYLVFTIQNKNLTNFLGFYMHILIVGKLLLIGILLGGILMVFAQFNNRNTNKTSSSNNGDNLNNIKLSALPNLFARFLISVAFFSIIFIFVSTIVLLIR